MAEEWSMERVAEQFRLEVRQAFEKENAAFRAEEEADLERLKADPEHAVRIARDSHLAEALAVRDSLFWDLYSNADVQVVNNSVKVVLPRGIAVYPDFIEMFNGTSVGWGKAAVDAEIVDGEPRVVIELILIDYWDDDRAAAWLVEKVQRAS
jgi:hypothetical protein